MAIKSKVLTPKQREIYTVISNYKKEYKKYPMMTEISKIIGKHKTTTRKMLKNMEEKGYIEYKKYKQRGIRLVGDWYDESIYFCEDDIEEEKYE